MGDVIIGAEEVAAMFPTAEEGRGYVKEIAEAESFAQLMDKLIAALEGHSFHEMLLAFSELLLVVLRTIKGEPHMAPSPQVPQDAANMLRDLILEEGYAPEQIVEFIGCLLTHHVCVAEHNFRRWEHQVPPGVTVN